MGEKSSLQCFMVHHLLLPFKTAKLASEASRRSKRRRSASGTYLARATFRGGFGLPPDMGAAILREHVSAHRLEHLLASDRPAAARVPLCQVRRLGVVVVSGVADWRPRPEIPGRAATVGALLGAVGGDDVAGLIKSVFDTLSGLGRTRRRGGADPGRADQAVGDR